jgi:2-aminoadipate transaminase
MARVSASAIMDLIKTTAAGNYISFASGLPDPELYPIEALRAIADRVLVEEGRAALQYGPAEGHPPLREWVAGRLRARGLAEATPEHVLITNGSQQALDLTARLLLDPGDRVLLDRPSYLAAIQVFDSFGVTYDAVPVDEDGMDAEEAARRLRAAPPKLVFALPNFQNPTGVTLSLDRRRRLAEAVAASDAALLEDDAYHDLRYEGEPLPPLTALAANPWALYSGTFSKTIAPGIRIGYLYARPELIERLGQLKQITDLHTGSLTQRMALRFCLEGHLDPQIRLLCDVYRERRDRMLAALDGLATLGLRWTRPAGGMFIFVTLPEGLDAEALLPRCLEQGVVFVPGRPFHPDGGGQATLRLNFVSSKPEAIHRGMALLGGVLAEAVR